MMRRSTSRARRPVRRLAAAVAAVALVATACGGADDTDTDVTDTDVDEEPTEEVTDETAEGGELRVVLPREPATLDPVFAVVSDAAIFGAFIEPLILPDPTMEPTSDGLITDWERIDETTWQFDVREGVEFHNGEPLDAEAVAWNVLNNRDAEGILSSFFASIEDATAADEHTLEVTTAAPNNSLVSLFMVTYVVPPEYYQEVGSDGFSEEPVGTGPFLYADRAVGERISAERNPDYWGEPANLDAITWTYAGDGSTRANLLMTGDADVEFSVAFETLDSLLEADGVDVTTYESLSKVSLFLVDDRPPLDDDDLREAVARAIDRDLIAEELFGGDGVSPSRNLLDIGDYGATEPHGFAYEPDAARELVDGAATEATLPMISVIDRGPRARDVGEALAGMLEAVGFTVERDPRPYAEMVEDALSQNVSGLYVMPKTSLAPHPFFWTNGFLTTDSLTKNCSDPRYDELAAEALAAPTPEEGAEVYTEIDDIALTQNICMVPVFDEVSHLATGEGVSGLEMRADGLPMDFGAISVS